MKRSVLFVLLLVGLAVSPVDAQPVPPLPASTTYLLPLTRLGVSSATVADLRARLAPGGEGPLVGLGYSTYINIVMSDWNVDTSDPAAVRAALASTLASIDATVQAGVDLNIPIGLFFGTANRAQYDPVQLAAELEDRRNTQWYTDNALAPGWVGFSQYARKFRRVQEAYIREVGRAVAAHMSRHPDIVVAAVGDGEVEMSWERWRDITQVEPASWADYSPFAIAEFRDWLRGDGLYADGQPLAGQGYEHRARYRGDATPGVDSNGDGHTLNGDFLLNFSTWELRYFDWNLTNDIDNDPNRIPATTYSTPGWNPLPDRGAEFFDAPRVMHRGLPWWDAWVLFRQEMILRHNRDFAKWMTTAVDTATGATIPAERWYSGQIPADYLFYNPDKGGPNDFGVRLMTSASPWWTADVSPYGSIGITAYNVNEGGGNFMRTLTWVAPEIARRQKRWGIIEWNPSDPYTDDPAIYREDVAVVEQYGPSLLMPFIWGDPDHWRVQDSGFEIALREFVARIGKPRLTVDRGSLNASVVRGTTATPAQDVVLSQIGAGTVNWTASADQPWLQVSPASGTGGARLTLTIDATNPAVPFAGQTVVRITIASPEAYKPATVDVTVTVQNQGATAPPFGQIDTPVQNATGVQGAIGVTGWAIDDVGVAGVKIYRNCLPFDNPESCQVLFGYNVVFIGDAAFVPGARPDVETAYSSFPQAYRGGWGYLMLTNMLPHVPNGQVYGGQGSLTLYAIATDLEGQTTLLGRTSADSTPTSIALNNDAITKPFGAIDTPGQGETIGGRSYANFGWALTRDADTAPGNGDVEIPTNGSTMVVFIDGQPTALVAFNQCRGLVGNPVPVGAYCDDDVANIFGNTTPQAAHTVRTANPTRYRNLDEGRAAIGAYVLDTTQYANGLHSIAWSVTDSAGVTEGIGSRNFIVLNTGAGDQGPGVSSVTTATLLPLSRVSDTNLVAAAAPLDQKAASRVLRDASTPDPRSPIPAPADAAEVRGRVGYDLRTPLTTLEPDDAGVRHVQIPELGRVELHLPGVTTGYLVANGTQRELPPGSKLDAETGVFTWAPVAGFIGTYRLRLRFQSGIRPGFHSGSYPGLERDVDVTIRPITSAIPADEAQIRMSLDNPLPHAIVKGTLHVGGWALDPLADIGSGIRDIHVWAQRTDAPGEAAVFLGVATLGIPRPDVARDYGAQFGHAGFELNAPYPNLAPGEYDITAYVWNVRTARWEDARTTRVTLR